MLNKAKNPFPILKGQKKRARGTRQHADGKTTGSAQQQKGGRLIQAGQDNRTAIKYPTTRRPEYPQGQRITGNGTNCEQSTKK
jgi:hypothetical protein